ncbi:MAG: 30S ribosomal protein S16 [Cyclobacteriaceae bacterium]
MAVKIRLARRGRKKLAIYDVVVADSRAPRDGRFIEKLGIYNPNTNPASIDLREDKALDWLLKGAKPTDTVRAILSYRGIMLKKHLQIGVNKGAITQEEADKRFDDWIGSKEAQVSGKKESLAQKREDERKARLEAERKISEARAKELAAAQAPAEEETASEEATSEEATEQAPADASEAAAQAAAAEETQAEAPAKETPKAEEKKEAKTEEKGKDEVVVSGEATIEMPKEDTKEETSKAEEKKEDSSEEKKEE